jgi:hypothetical protein
MRVSSCLAVLLIGMSPAVAKECRMPDLPPGARVPIPAECKNMVRVKDSNPAQEDLKAHRGFIDQGGGTKVRIGGGVRAEYGVRR